MRYFLETLWVFSKPGPIGLGLGPCGLNPRKENARFLNTDRAKAQAKTVVSEMTFETGNPFLFLNKMFRNNIETLKVETLVYTFTLYNAY